MKSAFSSSTKSLQHHTVAQGMPKTRYCSSWERWIGICTTESRAFCGMVTATQTWSPKGPLLLFINDSLPKHFQDLLQFEFVLNFWHFPCRFFHCSVKSARSEDQGLKVLCVVVDHFLCNCYVTDLEATQLAREDVYSSFWYFFCLSQCLFNELHFCFFHTACIPSDSFSSK